MYQIQITTPPSGECVQVSDLKAHLRLNTTDEDALLGNFITSARMTFENLTGRVVMATGFRQYNYAFTGPLYLMRGQVSAIADVFYYDQNDTLQQLNGYLSDIVGIPASVWMAGGNYPQTSVNLNPKVYVDFTAGWANSGAVPALVSQAILLLASHYFEYRTAYEEKKLVEIPQGFVAVCDQYRTGLYGTWDKHQWTVAPGVFNPFLYFGDSVYAPGIPGWWYS